MSERYKFAGHYAHFITFTVVGWVDVFTRREYAELVLESLVYCRTHKGLKVHEFAIMPNHVHLIACANDGDLGGIIRDLKRHTSRELVRRIAVNPRESRREWMLRTFREHGATNKRNDQNQFWQQGNHPIILDTPEKYEQRRRYLRENPLRAGLVNDERAYMWSSANEELEFELDE